MEWRKTKNKRDKHSSNNVREKGHIKIKKVEITDITVDIVFHTGKM